MGMIAENISTCGISGIPSAYLNSKYLILVFLAARSSNLPALSDMVNQLTSNFLKPQFHIVAFQYPLSSIFYLPLFHSQLYHHWKIQSYVIILYLPCHNHKITLCTLSTQNQMSPTPSQSLGCNVSSISIHC